MVYSNFNKLFKIKFLQKHVGYGLTKPEIGQCCIPSLIICQLLMHKFADDVVPWTSITAINGRIIVVRLKMI